MAHTYSQKQRQQHDKYYKLNMSLEEFNRLIHTINEKLEIGVSEVNAIAFIKQLKDQHRVMDNINGYLFGVQPAAIKNIMLGNDENGVPRQQSRSVIGDIEKMRKRNMEKVKTFNLVKKAAWGCVLKDESDGV